MKEARFCHYIIATKGIRKGESGEGRNFYAVSSPVDLPQLPKVQEIVSKMNTAIFTMEEIVEFMRENKSEKSWIIRRDPEVYLLNQGLFVVRGLIEGANYQRIPQGMEYDPTNPPKSEDLEQKIHGAKELYGERADGIIHARVWQEPFWR